MNHETLIIKTLFTVIFSLIIIILSRVKKQNILRFLLLYVVGGMLFYFIANGNWFLVGLGNIAVFLVLELFILGIMIMILFFYWQDFTKFFRYYGIVLSIHTWLSYL